MKCPFCSSIENRVIDSRLSRDGNIIRRRRECTSCQRRFTTHERVEEISPVVIKKDGRREPFDRNKIFAGIQRACEKRPVSIEVIDSLIEKMERDFQEKGDKEIKSTEIGERVMQELHNLDEVAYVRFASVYRQFKDISEFMAEVRELLSTKTKNNPS
ncbi:MAG TPA: transcriptional regulator NrdR [Thermodesulfobacteriota bacterium]|jgi:transcriptional repressor NrdR|nr:transcriptional regulator NrdR [Thermodesulfobacteriota bacterium]